MATIQIADDDARVQYTQAVTANVTQLTIDYPFFDLDDINVIITDAAGTDTILTRGTGTGTFAVVGTAVDDGFSGGYITLGDSYISTTTYTLFRDIPVERTTDFPTSGPFNITSLNTELDKIIAIEQELETKITRTLQLADSDGTVDLKLPNLDTRKGTTLAFNATTGEPEAGPTVAGVTTVGALAADIATLADIEDGTVATDAISDAAAIASDITTVSGIASNVTTTAGNTTNINTVAGNTTNINTVAGISANVTTVAGISSNVTTAAGISADITAVAADATDIGTVSASIADVNTVAGISADVTTVAADGTDIGVVAGISSDVTTVSGISANVTTVAGNTTNINAVAADATDIGTVATNIANVNTVAGIDANVTTVAGIAADITAAATNVSDIQAISTAIADVITVANDLNEATSEIDVVANNITNVNAVGTDIANVNTVAANLTDVNAFADTYFISATAPSSPTQGDLWFDTDPAALLMKVYDGSGWVNAGSSVNGTSQRVTYTATAGQTSFAATYDAGFVDVYLNGIKLIDGTDFTATSGTSVVLASGAALNDTVDIVAYGTFTLLSTVLDDLSDVSTSGATSGQVLSYNGASWAASTPSVPTLSSLGIDNHDELTVDASGNLDVTGTIKAKGGSTSTQTTNAGLIANSSGKFVVNHGNEYGLYTGYINSTNDAIGIASTTNAGTSGPLVLQPFGGNLGIGTDSPVSTMDVNGVISLGGSTSRSINYRSGNNDILYEFDAGDFYRQNIGSSQHEFFTGNANRMTIDSSGRVTMPYQPIFSANRSGYSTANNINANVPFTPLVNQGNHWNTSTHTFTCPVAGKYWVSVFNLTYTAVNSGPSHIQIRKNGGAEYVAYQDSPSGSNYHNSSASGVLDCAANDTIAFFSPDGVIYSASYCGATVYLIG